MNIQLGHQRGPVIVDGFGADVQPGTDFCIRHAACHKVQNLPLSWRQLWTGRAFFQQSDHIGRYEFCALDNQIQAALQQRWITLFQEQSVDTRRQQVAQQPRRTQTRINRYPRLWRVLLDLKKHLRALRLRHGDIQNRKIRLVRFSCSDGVWAGRYVSDDFKAQLLDNACHAPPNNRVIIRNQCRTQTRRIGLRG